MRIHRLDVEGFGPFRDEQSIDFDAFAHDGIFLIGGKTGAGKSSILDAISFALYGGVPRYDDGEKRFRSDHSALDEPTRVRLEFSAAGRRFRVERVPSYERVKKSGSGTTVSPAEARLDELVGDTWVGLAARSVDVANELKPILGLTQAQFLQVILLAQGRFAQFLHARNDERQALLQTLFDSRRFEDYEAELERRRKDALARLALEDRTLAVQLENAERLAGELLDDEPGGGTTERLERVRQANMRAAHAAEVAGADEQTAQIAKEATDAALAALTRQRETQVRRDRARVALAELEERADEVGMLREELGRSTAAEALRAALDAVDRASAVATGAEAALADAEATWRALGEQPAEASALEARADALLAERGTWEQARAAEAEAATWQAARAAIDQRLAILDAEAEQVEERRAELPGLIERASALSAAAAERAGAKADVEQRVVAARERVEAARTAEALAAAVGEADDRARAAGKALTRASAALDELRDRRFRDHAGELAEQLVDGEACAVCGATEHPSPATRADAPVTDELIATAEAHKAGAIETDAAATAALLQARELLVDARARAAGHTEAEARAALDAANAAVAAVTAAGAEVRIQEHERATLGAELSALTARAAELATTCAAHRAESVTLDDTIARGTAAVTAARGEFETVDARIRAAEAVVAAARSLAAARRAATDASAGERVAAADLAARLSETDFADAAAARAALRPAAARTALHEVIGSYDTEVAALKQTRLELELEALPEEPIDTTAAASAAAEAASAWRSAVARHAQDARRATQLAEASDAAVIAHEAIADLTDEAAVIARLADTVAGRAPNTRKMNLETFVLAAELEDIVAAANTRLDEMSAGRYLLRHTDAIAHRGAASGLGIEVMDRHTGQARPVQSLSGGETFLASLALALGLAEVVTARSGGIRLDTLFIDEGFGSLDGDTLEVAMRTLDELRQGGRVVGIISHVDAMKDEIPSRLLVEVTPQGPSVIRQDTLV